MSALTHISQLHEFPPGTRLAVYGAGSGGKALLRYVLRSGTPLEVALFVDRKGTGTLEGVEVIDPDQLDGRGQDFDELFVCSAYAEEIEGELGRRGIARFWTCDPNLVEYMALSTNPCLNQERRKLGKDMSFMPTKDELRGERGLERFILDGYVPREPFIARDTRLTAFGSCFARHIREYLAGRGYAASLDDARRFDDTDDYAKSYMYRMPWNFNNTFSIRQQFEWALEDEVFLEDLWFDEDKAICLASGDAKEATRRLLLETEVFIMTIGLAEVWENTDTSEVFWRTVPSEFADPDKHRFRLSTVDENHSNLERIYGLIRKHVPNARVVLTLSPVPLRATFRDVSCVTANSVSKAILRVAIDELWRRHRADGHLYYWPSYEIIKEAISDPYEDDNRHVRSEVVSSVMELFARHYLV